MGIDGGRNFVGEERGTCLRRDADKASDQHRVDPPEEERRVFYLARGNGSVVVDTWLRTPFPDIARWGIAGAQRPSTHLTGVRSTTPRSKNRGGADLLREVVHIHGHATVSIHCVVCVDLPAREPDTVNDQTCVSDSPHAHLDIKSINPTPASGALRHGISAIG